MASSGNSHHRGPRGPRSPRPSDDQLGSCPSMSPTVGLICASAILNLALSKHVQHLSASSAPTKPGRHESPRSPAPPALCSTCAR